MTEVKIYLAGFNPNVFSVFHLNITKHKETFKRAPQNIQLSTLVLFVFLAYGLNHKRNQETKITFYKAKLGFINVGNIKEEDVSV